MFNIFMHRIVLELCRMEKKRKEEVRRRKKMNKIEIFMLGFLDFAKG